MHRALFEHLLENNLNGFTRLVEKEAETVKEKDYAFYDLIYFLLDLAKFRKDRNTYKQLCEKYKRLVGEEQKEAFDEK